MTRIILASTSPYRRALLARLVPDFRVVAPAVAERTHPGESPWAMASRLAEEKARDVARRAAGALVIGSDQVAALAGEILRKPGNARVNREQLARAAGQRVEFHTAVCLVHADSGRARVSTVPFVVHFRALTGEQIACYVEREQAFDCAGGFRCEGLGSALFERLQGEDPTALVGLPLIRLTEMLALEGVDVLSC